MDIFERYASKINYYQAPGMPSNKVAIFVDKDVYTESGNYFDRMIETYVNTTLIPWAFMNGVYCTGISHGNFVYNRQYCKVTEVPKKKEEDYSLNVDVLNFVMAVMVASEEHANGKEGITMVEYVGEADMCMVREFADEKAFEAEVKEWLEEIEREEE